MRSSLRSRRLLVQSTTVVALSAASLAAAYFVSGEDTRNKVRNIPASVYRVLNLGATAVSIVYDYKTTNISTTADNEKRVAHLHKKLQTLQDDLDSYIVKRYDKSNSEKEVEYWIDKARMTRLEIEENTELIGQEQSIISDSENSRSGLHRKAAKKLANM